MAANRKLLADVEKTLKKIQEGQKAFQDIFEKFNESANQAQKEKFENELKREIKKLQRYREQIKSWQTSNEIKDKRNLGDARRSIESDMERFKIIEKETKTKAYSKEGLGAEQKKDPLQKEKEDIMEWVRETISELEQQIEKLEYDIELMVANSKKKKLDKDKQEEMDNKKEVIGKHRFHIQRLEAIMRMLDNDNLELDKVKNIKDDVEYYVNQNEEPGFWDNYNENIYDELELEDIGDISSTAILATSPHDSIDEPPSSVAAAVASQANSATVPATAPGAPPVAVAPVALSDGAIREAATVALANPGGLLRGSTAAGAAAEAPAPAPAQPPSVIQQLPVQVPAAAVATSHPLPPLLLSGQHHQPQLPPTTMTSSQATTNDGSDREGSTTSVSEVASPSVLSGGQLKSQDLFSNLGGSANSQSSSQGGSGPPQPLFRINQVGTPSQPQQQQQQLIPQQQQQIVSSLLSGAETSLSVEPLLPAHQQRSAVRPAAVTAPTQQQQQPPPPPPPPQLQSQQPTTPALTSAFFSSGQTDQQHQHQHPADLKQLSQAILARQPQQQIPQAPQQPAGNASGSYQSYMSSSAVAAAAAVAAAQQQQQQQQLQTIRLDPMSIAAPLRSQTPPRLQEALSKLENGFKKLPHAADSERFRQHTTHNPTQVPFYYPQSPPPGMDTEEFYNRLDVQTLFFIFYYFEGTKAQYLAAKALKKLSWRFHTKYLMWFQRHEEPKTITDDYEKGTYVYYDYEKAMQKRREFTFEYKYLEDKDL